MNTLTKITLSSALCAAIAAPAFAGGYAEPAADPVIDTPVVDVAPTGGDWTGPWVGARLGYADADVGDTGASGETYGLSAGYDYDFGQWVVGGALDYEKANVDLDGGAGSIDTLARLKLRGGYDFGQTLLYATAGAAYAEATVGATDVSDNGWFGGVGAEYKLNDSWSVGGEVLYHDFSNFDDSGIDVDATTATLMANYRF